MKLFQMMGIHTKLKVLILIFKVNKKIMILMMVLVLILCLNNKNLINLENLYLIQAHLKKEGNKWMKYHHKEV